MPRPQHKYSRRCPRCGLHISRSARLCPVCRKLNLRPIDYLLTIVAAVLAVALTQAT